MAIAYFRAKFHKNRGTTMLFGTAIGTGTAFWALARYMNSVRVFNQLPELPDAKLEEERVRIAKRAFTNDYLMYSEAVEAEYMDSLPVNQFKFKKMLD